MHTFIYSKNTSWVTEIYFVGICFGDSRINIATTLRDGQRLQGKRAWQDLAIELHFCSCFIHLIPIIPHFETDGLSLLMQTIKLDRFLSYLCSKLGNENKPKIVFEYKQADILIKNFSLDRPQRKRRGDDQSRTVWGCRICQLMPLTYCTVAWRGNSEMWILLPTKLVTRPRN